MDDLISLQNKAFEAIKKFQNIESFSDLELWLLQGKGLSPNTKKSYMDSIRLFYNFYDGLHPLQWTIGHIEKWFDDIRERNNAKTASLRICGLKKMCESIKQQMPFWDNPFDIIEERLSDKFKAAEQGEKKEPLYKTEIQAVLEHLRNDTSLAGLQNYAMVLTLLTTGLRAQELCNLTFESIKHDPDVDIYYLKGTGKGGKKFTQEVHPDAIRASLSAFKTKFGRTWRVGDYMFYNEGSPTKKNPSARMNKPCLWLRLKEIGIELKSQDKIRTEIEFSCHLFRRTYCTLLHKEGMTLVALQGQSRHSNVKTLVDHYVNDKESTRVYMDRILGVA